MGSHDIIHMKIVGLLDRLYFIVQQLLLRNIPTFIQAQPIEAWELLNIRYNREQPCVCVTVSDVSTINNERE